MWHSGVQILLRVTLILYLSRMQEGLFQSYIAQPSLTVRLKQPTFPTEVHTRHRFPETGVLSVAIVLSTTDQSW